MVDDTSILSTRVLDVSYHNLADFINDEFVAYEEDQSSNPSISTEDLEDSDEEPTTFEIFLQSLS